MGRIPDVSGGTRYRQRYAASSRGRRAVATDPVQRITNVAAVIFVSVPGGQTYLLGEATR